MNGIVIDIDPVIVHLGMFPLRWYAVFTIVAAGAAWWLGLREARRRGLTIKQVEGALVPIFVGALIGGRVLHVVDRPDLYVSQPAEVLAIWNGGLAVWGGIIGGTLAGLLYFRRLGLNLRVVLDVAAPAMILGQGLGRLACIPNGDAYGAPANLPWAFIYTNPAAMVPRELLGVPLQPYPIYELVFDLALFGALWALRNRPAFVDRPGLLFATYIGLYSVGRFALTFTRVEKVWLLGLQEAQVFSLVGLVGAMVAVVIIWRRASRTVGSARASLSSEIGR